MVTLNVVDLRHDDSGWEGDVIEAGPGWRVTSDGMCETGMDRTSSTVVDGWRIVVCARVPFKLSTGCRPASLFYRAGVARIR